MFTRQKPPITKFETSKQQSQQQKPTSEVFVTKKSQSQPFNNQQIFYGNDINNNDQSFGDSVNQGLNSGSKSFDPQNRADETYNCSITFQNSKNYFESIINGKNKTSFSVRNKNLTSIKIKNEISFKSSQDKGEIKETGKNFTLRTNTGLLLEADKFDNLKVGINLNIRNIRKTPSPKQKSPANIGSKSPAKVEKNYVSWSKINKENLVKEEKLNEIAKLSKEEETCPSAEKIEYVFTNSLFIFKSKYLII